MKPSTLDSVVFQLYQKIQNEGKVLIQELHRRDIIKKVKLTDQTIRYIVSDEICDRIVILYGNELKRYRMEILARVVYLLGISVTPKDPINRKKSQFCQAIKEYLRTKLELIQYLLQAINYCYDLQESQRSPKYRLIVTKGYKRLLKILENIREGELVYDNLITLFHQAREIVNSMNQRCQIIS